MGSLTDTSLSRLVRKLRDEYNLTTLIETGTFLGESTLWAAQNFDKVITIEVSPKFQTEAKFVLRYRRNIEFALGDSRNVLPPIVEGLKGDAFFWLDAHSHRGSIFGNHDDCPIMEELEAILPSPHRHVVLIDDARFIQHHLHGEGEDRLPWPEMPLISALAAANGYDMQVLEHDVILMT